MKTAISVDLGGASYSLDQDAFLTLHAYLARAADRLGEHPDRDEVLAGLERSVGAKLARGGERSAPIGAAEMAAALKEVGKVDGPRLGPERADAQADLERDGSEARPTFGSDRAGRTPSTFDAGGNARPDFDPDSHAYAYAYDSSPGPRPRRLYRLDDGKKIAGVCTGIAAYLDLDVGLVRVLVVLAAFFTGFFLLAALYIGLMFLVPLARTSTEIAAAHGALRSA
jgi:phage shock protein PspC (stress-responsive transcriptional regulator)